METVQVLTDFRREADDRVEPYLLSDEDLCAWLSEAEREASVRAKLIYDRAASEVTRIAVVPGQQAYRIDPRLFEVEAVYLDRSAALPGQRPACLDRTDTSRVRRRGLFGTSGRLREYAIDGETLTLFPAPDTSFTAYPATLLLSGYRLPLYEIEAPDDDLEIPAVHHDGLVNWMLWRAFSQKDAETGMYDDARANRALALFEARYGPRPSASAMRMRAEHRRWTTRPASYP